MVHMFPKFYPLSNLERYASSLINDFYKPFFLYMFIFILSGSYYAEFSKISFLISASLAVLSAHFVRRSLQYIIDFTTKPSMRFIHIVVLLAGVYYISIFFFNTYDMISQLGLIILLLLLIGFLQESFIQTRKAREVQSINRLSNISLKLLWNNKKVRLPLLVGFGFKILFVLGYFFLYQTEKTHIIDKSPMIWLFVSPLVIYTYVFHNVWGFWKDLWMTTELRISGYGPKTKQVFQLISIPLIIDLMITLPLLFIAKENLEFIILYYITTSLFLLAQSFLWSLITPRKITASFQIRGSVSPWAVIISMLSIFILAAVKNSQWFYFLIPILILLAAIAYGLSLYLYKDKKYILSDKLLKD